MLLKTAHKILLNFCYARLVSLRNAFQKHVAEIFVATFIHNVVHQLDLMMQHVGQGSNQKQYR